MKLLWFSVIGIGVLILIQVSFAHQNQHRRRLFLIVISLIGAIFYLIYWATVILIPEDLLLLLPLQLCDLAIFLMPIGLMTQKQNLMDFLFYPCGLGALAAIMAMSLMSSHPYYVVDVNFFFSHFSIIVIPLLCILWGLYDPKPSLRKAIRLTVILLVLAALMHGLNLVLYTQYHAEAFYFFTIRRVGILVSPILAFFAIVIPYDYFYMILVLPLLYGYMALIYWIRKRIVSSQSKRLLQGAALSIQYRRS